MKIIASSFRDRSRLAYVLIFISNKLLTDLNYFIIL